MNDDIAKKILTRFDSMKSLRGTWETHWQEIADFVLTRKATINRTEFPGSKRNLQIFDSTAIQANELLAGALHSLLTNPSATWFELSTGNDELDQDDEARLWLQNTTQKIHDTLNQSNFQTEIHEIYIDLGAFGTSGLEIMEDDESVVRFRAHPISEIYVDENNKHVVDTVYRKFKWSARQIIQEFGEEAVGSDLIQDMQRDPSKQFTLIHAIFPSKDIPQIETAASFPIASVYVVLEHMKTVSMGGFREMPFAVPRWMKATGEIYGRSPAIKALPDIKMLNAMMKTTIKGAQKAVDPPLMVPDDGFIAPIRTLPGGLNYFRSGSGDRIEPLLTGARPDLGIQLIEFTASKVRDAFFIDQLQLNEGPQMTATEVLQRTEEKMRLLAPILARQESELLRPMIDRVFSIMVRRKIIDDPPEILQGMNLKVAYNSLIARAQKSQEAQNILRAFESAAPFIQADPSVLDNLDGDSIVRIIMKRLGAPEEVIRNADEIKQLREARSQAQQQQAQLEQEQQQAQTAQMATQAAATANQAG